MGPDRARQRGRGAAGGRRASPRLLDHGRTAAAAHGLDWLSFVRADVATFGVAGSYDLVQCVLGVFFLPDTDAGTRHLVGLARPGGRVVVTTWAQGAIEPIRSAVAEVLPVERPELRESLSTPPPADRVQTPETLSGWLTSLGLLGVDVHQVPLSLALDAGVVQALFEGTALRGLLGGLDAGARSRVLARLTDAALSRGSVLDATALVATGTAP